jgi:hypothetical protein
MLLGLIVWLLFAVLGLRWVLGPYWFAARGGLNASPAGVRAEFPVRLAPLPEEPPQMAVDEEEGTKTADDWVATWVWRETLRRFLLGFSLWMGSGWFVHWLTSRIIYGPQRWRGHRQ